MRTGNLRLFCGALSLLLTPLCGAADHDTAQRGREIFERKWEYRAPSETGGGDGLGPMFNANSCASCHAGGGGAGVDRNVTLLTLEPHYGLVQELVALLRGGTAADVREQQQRQARERLHSLHPALLAPNGTLTMEIVVHDHSVRPLYELMRNSIALHLADDRGQHWFHSDNRTSDQIAARPVLAGRIENLDFYLSQRNSPPLFGLGLIDRIDPRQLQRIAQSQASRNNGRISGRLGAGKFGWRGQTVSLESFVHGACAGELGLQTSNTPQPDDVVDESYINVGLDMMPVEVQQLTTYIRFLPAPVRQTDSPQQAAAARDGEKLFAKIGCLECHVRHLNPAYDIYSDLLMHDMGDQLQAPSPAPPSAGWFGVPSVPIPVLPVSNPLPRDSLRRGFGSGGFGSGGSVSGYYGGISGPRFVRPYHRVDRPLLAQFPPASVPLAEIHTTVPADMTWDLLQREWRTPPLWGVADSAPYLHDGRADTLDQAIRWHGGEAAQSAAEYNALSSDQQRQVIAFLSSLRAPPSAGAVQFNDPAEMQPPAPQQLHMMAASVDVFGSRGD